MTALFNTDDRRAKHNSKLVDWSHARQSQLFVIRHAAAHLPWRQRWHRLLALTRETNISQQLFQARCTQSARILGMLDFVPATVQAVAALDEHWDGMGQPAGLHGDAIPVLGRIACLAQTAEIFFRRGSVSGVLRVAQRRRGTWFDPHLVDVLVALKRDQVFWQQLAAPDVLPYVAALEPPDRVILADEAYLDRIAHAFAQVVDAKSSWTAQHSLRVSQLVVGMGEVLQWSPQQIRDMRRAALLHDIGKLSVSNLILDKPGPLTDAERTQMQRHPWYTERILKRVSCFAELADVAAAHHERLDGRGYHQGLVAEQLSQPARVLAVADVCEALSAARPYRGALPWPEVLGVMRRDVNIGLCPVAFAALEACGPQWDMPAPVERVSAVSPLA